MGLDVDVDRVRTLERAMGRVDKVPRPKVARQRLGTMKTGGRASTWNRPATLRFWRVEDELDGGWGESREERVGAKGKGEQR